MTDLLFSRLDGVVLHPEIPQVFKHLVGREASPLPKVRVETVSDEPASESAYAPVFKSFGFKSDGSALVLWRVAF